jgi:hypothetical protein
MIPVNDTVFVEKSGALDDWGRPTESTVEEHACRIDYRSEKVTSDNGEEVVSKAVILIKGIALITSNDTLTWSDDFGEHEAKPISISPLKDFSSKVLFTKVVV